MTHSLHRLRHFIVLLLSLVLCSGSSVSWADDPPPTRTRAGLQVLYDFEDVEGTVVKDRSGRSMPMHLQVRNPEAVARSKGALTITGQTIIRSQESASRLNSTIKRSGELTIEAWLSPADNEQSGPARIFTLSKNGSERNVTLGQAGDKFDVRLRTTRRSKNGVPSLSALGGSLKAELTHVVYTRGRSGTARVYLDGALVSEDEVEGSLTNWNSSFRLALGNEFSNDRAWRGTYHLVAVFSRDLSATEVQRHFSAGPNAATAAALESAGKDLKTAHFEQKIAPLLANHCLECHDTVNNKGELDLSRKATAFKGTDERPVLVAGSLAQSVLWESVESEDMPKKRTPLNDEEKRWLKQWIENGAVWSKETIDPADYTHSVSNDVWVRRLTIPEYVATVKSAVGVDIAKQAREILPPDLRADGFSNTAYNLNVDLKHVEAYGRLAEMIVRQMDVSKFADSFSKTRKFTDNDMGKLIARMGKWLLRGPIEEDEIIAYRGVSTTVASAGGSYDEAIGLIIEAMLQSPRFIYRVENQRGDGNAYPANEYELASRMSYILWGGPPDKNLLRAAEDGDLYDPNHLKAQVVRMLKDSRAMDQSLQFAGEWLHLGRLENLRPDVKKFPEWDAVLAADMREESLAFFQRRHLGTESSAGRFAQCAVDISHAASCSPLWAGATGWRSRAGAL